MELLYAAVCGGLIHYFGWKSKRYKILWIITAFIPFFWIGERLFPSVIALSLLSESTMMVLVITFMVVGFSKIHWSKFLLDAVTITILTLGVASGVVFSHMDALTLGSSSFVLLVINLLIDIIVVVSTLLMFTSVTVKLVDRSLYIMGLSFAAYIYADFDKMYESIDVGYVASYSRYAFFISFGLMAFASIIENSKLRPDRERLEQNPDNLLNTRVVLYFMILPLFLFIINEISIAHLTVMSIIVIVYQYIGFYVQKLYFAEKVVSEKEVVMKQLEELVEERTKALKESNDILYTKSITDSLTGLYNKEYMVEYIKNAIEKDEPVGLLYLSLDRFSVINSYHGHLLGDRILITVGERLKELEREGVITARLNGDEFAVLVPTDKYNDFVEETERITRSIHKRITVDGFFFHLEANIGIARYPEDTHKADELLRDAVLAMSYVKNQNAKSDFALYSSVMIEKIERLNYIELLLRDADFNNEFELYYQPKFDVNRNQVIGMEALLRWHHVEEGFISPEEFIPIAEETGLILEISDWVFEKAIKQVNIWNRKYGADLAVSINVSPASFDSYNFIPDFKQLINMIGVRPHWVELEVTEHVAISSETRNEEIFEALRDLGIFISIDDFGTGYSSLSYIKRFEIDVIKIPRELVMNIVEDINERLIVQAIVTMAKGMGLSVIAEGVETSEQLTVLTELGCNIIQGYYTGRPVDAERFEEKYLIEFDK